MFLAEVIGESGAWCETRKDHLNLEQAEESGLQLGHSLLICSAYMFKHGIPTKQKAKNRWTQENF